MNIRINFLENPAIKILILALLYFGSGKLAFYFSIHDGIVSYVAFFPEGIGLAFTLLFGYSMGIGIFLGQFFLVWSSDLPLLLSIIIATINASLTMGGKFLLEKINFSSDLRDTKDIIYLLLISFLLITPLSAFLSHLSFYCIDYISLQRIFYSGISWWIANASGQILITPFLLSLYHIWKNSPEKFSVTSYIIWNIAGLGISLGVFTQMHHLSPDYRFIAFVILFPFFLLASIQNRLITIYSILIIINLIAFYNTSHGYGPFAKGSTFANYLHLNTLLMGLALTASIITVLLEKKQKVEIIQKKILDAFVDGIYIASKDFTVQYMNSAMIQLLGSDFTGKKCYEAFYNFSKPCNWCIYSQLLKEKKIMDYEIKIPGEEIYRNVRNILLENNEKLTIYYDITKQKKQALAIQKRLNYETAIANYSNSLLQGTKEELNKGLQGILYGTKTSRIYLYRNYMNEKNGLCAQIINGISTDNLSFNNNYKNLIIKYNSKYFIQWKKKLENNKIVSGHINDFSPSERKFMMKDNIQSILLIPIFVHKKWWGFIGFDDIYSQRNWNSEDIQILRSIAEMTGLFYELKENEHLIAEHNERLSELVSTKNKLLSIIAHDLKNPFNAILNITYYLLSDYDKIPEKERKNYIHSINESSEQAYQMLEDMLAWSKSLKDDFQYSPEKFKLKTIIKDTLKLKNSQALKKNIQLIDKTHEIQLFGDPRMIRTVLRNLVSNAIKFTPQYGNVTLLTDISDSEYCTITVKDTGTGIKKENIKKLFDPNSQISTLGTEQEKGTGLGLVICKDFVEKNKGHIWVESIWEEGSSFSFTIPRSNKLTNSTKSIPKGSPNPITIKPLTIRAAEDEIVNQIVLRTIFEREGHTIHIFGNGNDFLKNLKNDIEKYHYDVFLIDLHMPEVNGIDAIKKLKSIKNENFYIPPTFITTGEEITNEKQLVDSLEINGLISKPISYNKFIYEYTEYLNKKSPQKSGLNENS